MSGHVLAPGQADGEVLTLGAPLSLWGGLDPATGAIVDPRHPEYGRAVTGRVLVMPSGRGSSSSSTVLAEAIRLSTGPAAVILREPDGILALGSIAARHLYGVAVPVVIWNGSLPEGRVRVRAQGTTVSIDPA